MEEELEQYRNQCLALCERLAAALDQNKDEADSFFSGDIYRAYVDATEAAMNKVKKTKSKIRKL